MFNFLKKKTKKEKKDLSNKAIIYYSLADDNEVKVNVEIPDYNSDSMVKLASLISTIHSDSCKINTIEMIKEFLSKDKQEEMLVEFLLYITSLEGQKKVEAEKPCILPSDML